MLRSGAAIGRERLATPHQSAGECDGGGRSRREFPQGLPTKLPEKTCAEARGNSGWRPLGRRAAPERWHPRTRPACSTLLAISEEGADGPIAFHPAGGNFQKILGVQVNEREAHFALGHQPQFFFGGVLGGEGDEFCHGEVALANDHFLAGFGEGDVSAQLILEFGDIYGAHGASFLMAIIAMKERGRNARIPEAGRGPFPLSAGDYIRELPCCVCVLRIGVK